MATKLSRAQVNSWRMSAHHLSEKASPADISKVLSEVCGVQAQVLSAAELALRARIKGLTQQDVRDALWKSRVILKTWCMRGTLHLLASRDLPTYVAALRGKVSETQLWLQKSQGIMPSEVESVTAEIERALAHDTLTREELAERVIRRSRMRPQVAEAMRSGWGILLRPAAYQGALAFGPSTGPKVRFLRPRVTSKMSGISAEGALEELFRRFLRGYGPATIRDFGHWWGNLPKADAARLTNASDGIGEVEVEGRRALMIVSDSEAAAGMGATPVVSLLPSFDCYAMFYSPREAFVPQVHRNRIFRQAAGWNYPSVMVDGVAAGIWGLRRRGRRVEVEVEAFRTFTASEKGLITEEAEDIGRFLGATATVKF